ncbi:hypothetical protein CCACVL1_09518, partial [Corchorus capsularis]
FENHRHNRTYPKVPAFVSTASRPVDCIGFRKRGGESVQTP